MQMSLALEDAWDSFKRHTGALVATTFALVLTQAAMNAILARTASWMLSFMLSALLSGLIMGGQMNAARIAARSQEPLLVDAFAPFTARQGDYLLVGLAIGVGALLCGVGVVVTAFLFMFAPLRVIDGDDFKLALRESKNLVVDNLGTCVRLFLVVFALNVLGFITLIGWLASIPITSLMVVRAYERLRAPRVLPAGEATAAP